jgi:PilZ domain
MISTWIGYPLSPESSVHSPSHSQPDAASASAQVLPRALRESTRGRCSRRRTGQNATQNNRREANRTPHQAEITLDLLAYKASRQRSVKAQVVNAAEGGLCVVLKKSLLLSSVIRCRFVLAGLPVGVPTLLQVRWVKQVNGKYRCGLMYLL